MNSFALLLGLLSSVAAKDKCCARCQDPSTKYYSLTMLNGKCGEICIDPKDFSKFLALEPGLTKVHADHKGLTDCYTKGFGHYDSTVTHVFDNSTVSLKMDLYNPTHVNDAQELLAVSHKDKCCARCPMSTDKCYSLTMLDGKCGESCVDPKDFARFQALVPSLTKVRFGSDCYAKGFVNYDSTVAHVFDATSTFNIDLYDRSGPAPSPAPPSPAPPSPAPSPSSGPCCKACSKSNQVKYFSVDTRHGHCGECSMDPKHFKIFKIFESNLTISDGKTCEDFGYPTYDSTVTHGFGPLSMTLDLYDPKTAAEATTILI